VEAKFADGPDALWDVVAPLLPAEKPKPNGGRPREPDRRLFAGLVYRLMTGCQWKAIPREFGTGSTLHRRFATWSKAGVFDKAFAAMVRLYDERVGADLQWTSLVNDHVTTTSTPTSTLPRGSGIGSKEREPAS